MEKEVKKIRSLAYLRVSTNAQDVKNQKHGILDYCNKHGYTGTLFVEDSVSSKKNWRDRKLGELILTTAMEGDTLIFAEISRMARSTLEVLEVLKICSEKKVNVHIAKQNMIFDDSINSKITATVLGLAAEIEKFFISARTLESLNKRKDEIKRTGSFISKAGNRITHLGRPKGRASTVKLDQRKDEINMYLKKGINKRAISKLIDCAPSTLYAWIERQGTKLKVV